jgi:hypothetical protein
MKTLLIVFKILIVIARIIATPFFLIIQIPFYCFLIIKKTILFICYGGELLHYDKLTTPKTIGSVYELVLNQHTPKVCTGCGSLNTKNCCPDSNYIPIEDYINKSTYKELQFSK